MADAWPYCWIHGVFNIQHFVPCILDGSMFGISLEFQHLKLLAENCEVGDGSSRNIRS
jgi:hypothetical protein